MKNNTKAPLDLHLSRHGKKYLYGILSVIALAGLEWILSFILMIAEFVIGMFSRSRSIINTRISDLTIGEILELIFYVSIACIIFVVIKGIREGKESEKDDDF